MSDMNPISLLNASVQDACYLVPDKPHGNADAFLYLIQFFLQLI